LAKTYDFRINQAIKNKDADLQAKETANRDTTAAQGLIGAETLMSKTDTLLRQDYYFAGVVNQFKGKYDEAIELYKKAMGPLRNIEAKLPYRAPFHNCDSLTIYQNMVDCYSRANHHEEAIAQINALCDLKTQHGQSRNINDYVDLVSQYRAIGNDTLKIQSERFAAYVAADSLFACIQDSIDAGSDNFPFQEGRVGYYPYQRMRIRMRMNSLSDYKERDNYLYLESAEDVVRRIEVVVDKSSMEKDLISEAAEKLWRSYYNMKDYKSCLRYQTILSKYDPETADTYKKNFEFARRHAR
jgi:tetratricopeptide (TPR) repeat protein